MLYVDITSTIHLNDIEAFLHLLFNSARSGLFGIIYSDGTWNTASHDNVEDVSCTTEKCNHVHYNNEQFVSSNILANVNDWVNPIVWK